MSIPIRQVPTSNIHYDPLPFDLDAQSYGRVVHEISRSPSPTPPPAPPKDFSMDYSMGANRPRFMGPAATDDGASTPRRRDSFASFPSAASDHSVYPLNSGRNHLSPASFNTPTPSGYSTPRFDVYKDDPSSGLSTYDLSGMPVSKEAAGTRSLDYRNLKNTAYAGPHQKSKRKFVWLCGVAAVLAIIVIVVVVAVYFAVIKPHNSTSSQNDTAAAPASTSASSSSGQSSSPTTKVAITGGDGSTVTTDDGSTFTYSNAFGGYWYFDPTDPFNNGARAQSWTPALNETFNIGVDKIRGVNLGGWLVTEPFIVPSLYQQYSNNPTPPVDEWTLSEAMTSDTANGGLSQLENHYKTFITEQDFAQIAAAGLNFVRIPIGFWAIETWAGEPFLESISWTYFLKAIQWARKYGLRINLDFHALPGSQNGWNHSGRLGSVNVMLNAMGIANAQRSLDYVRILTEFVSQPEYKNVVMLFGHANEPQMPVIGQDVLEFYYLQAYNVIRGVTGIGEGNGPYACIHDGFEGQANWAGFLSGADRQCLDTHPYLCFATQSNAPLSTFVDQPCTLWGPGVNQSMAAFGFTMAGEWSVATNDCGTFVNGVGLGTRFEGTYNVDGSSYPPVGNCSTFVDWQGWDNSTKSSYMGLALSTMDSLQNWFFWTWKIGNSSTSGTVEAPHWSYSLGLQEGWIPLDPRDSVGECGNTDPFVGPLQSWATGGAGAGSIAATATASLAWPPLSISSAGAVSLLPTYTPTASIVTLPGPTFTVVDGKSTSTIFAGNGWYDSSDTVSLMTAIAGCSYQDPWGGTATPPSPLCSGGATVKRATTEATVTQAPA